METLECLKTRRSVRSYTSRMVEQNKLDQIMEAATYAPTGRGKQSPKIVLVKTPETVRLLSRLNAQVYGNENDPFYGAPVVAIVFGDTTVPTWFEDANLVAGNILNAAHGVGVDSCYVYRAKEVFEMEEGKALKKAWNLGDNYVGVANCILGYGDKEGQAAPRKKDYVLEV